MILHLRASDVSAPIIEGAFALNSLSTKSLASGQSLFNSYITYSDKEAIRSEEEKFNPALHFIIFLVAVSNEISVPSASLSFPATPEKLITGTAFSPMLVLMPAFS